MKAIVLSMQNTFQVGDAPIPATWKAAARPAGTVLARATPAMSTTEPTSTLVSVIAVPDIMYQVQMVSQQEMKAMPLYTGAAISFFVLIFVLTSLVERAGLGTRREA